MAGDSATYLVLSLVKVISSTTDQTCKQLIDALENRLESNLM